VELTEDGKKVWEWRTWEHLDPVAYLIPLIQSERLEWAHGNAIAELADENLLVSSATSQLS
jgi:hypothetical protein